MAVYGGPEITTSGLVLYLDAANKKSYPGTGTTWTDLSGNGNNGTLTNSPSYSSVRNGTIIFDGTNDYISITFPNTGLIPVGSGQRTIIANILYQSGQNVYYPIVDYGTYTTRNRYGLYLDNAAGNKKISNIVWANDLLSSATIPGNNTWHNICITYNGSTSCSFYINGILDSTSTFAANLNTILGSGNIFNIGKGAYESTYFRGSIASVYMYNRALSASEILNNYNALKGRYASYLTDPDAITYIAAVEAADGQELERSVALAYQDFIVGCKTDNIWSAIKTSCILMGARTLSGASVPLAGTGPTLNSIVSDDYNRKTGIKLDGSTKTMNTNVAPSAYSQDDSHFSVFLTEVNTANPANIFSAYGPSNNGSTIFDGGALQIGINSTTQYDGSVEQANKLLGASRSSSSTFSFRINGSTLSKSGTSASPTTYNYIVGAQLGSNTVWKSNARYSFYSVGNSLDLSKLDTRVSALYTAIGAAIP